MTDRQGKGVLWAMSEQAGRFAGAHNYQVKLQAMVAHGEIPMDEVNNVRIMHDDWCDVFNGGRCNCDPDIVVGE